MNKIDKPIKAAGKAALHAVKGGKPAVVSESFRGASKKRVHARLGRAMAPPFAAWCAADPGSTRAIAA
jgi:hypothetical protein